MVLNMKLEALGWYQSDHQLRQYQLITGFSILFHNTNGNIDEQWSLFRTALAKPAAGVLGYEKKHPPDWLESPLLL